MANHPEAINGLLYPPGAGSTDLRRPLLLPRGVEDTLELSAPNRPAR